MEHMQRCTSTACTQLRFVRNFHSFPKLRITWVNVSKRKHPEGMASTMFVNVKSSLAISKHDCDDSGDSGPQGNGAHHLDVPLRRLHATHRVSCCAKRRGHVQLCLKPRGARGIDSKIFGRGDQLSSCHAATTPRHDFQAL